MTVARERVKGEKTVSPLQSPRSRKETGAAHCAHLPTLSLRSAQLGVMPRFASGRHPWRPALVFGSPVRRFQRAPGHRCEFCGFSRVFVAVRFFRRGSVFYHPQRPDSSRFPAGSPHGGWAHQGNLAGTQARIQDWPPGRRPEGVSRQGRRVAPAPPDEAGVEHIAQRQVPSAMPGVQGDGRNVPLPVHSQGAENYRRTHSERNSPRDRNMRRLHSTTRGITGRFSLSCPHFCRVAAGALPDLLTVSLSGEAEVFSPVFITFSGQAVAGLLRAHRRGVGRIRETWRERRRASRTGRQDGGQRAGRDRTSSPARSAR